MTNDLYYICRLHIFVPSTFVYGFQETINVLQTPVKSGVILDKFHSTGGCSDDSQLAAVAIILTNWRAAKMVSARCSVHCFD